MSHEIFADAPTTDTTWQFQLQAKSGEWNWYSQVEYRTEQGCRDMAKLAYGGGLPYRIIRHDRTIIS